MKQEPTPQAPGWMMAALALALLLASLSTSIANVALPTLTRAFDVSIQAAQWVVLSYLLATTVFVVAVGRLGDTLGRRRLLLAGLGLFAVSSITCAAAPTLPFLIAARAVQGVGAAVMMALAMALVSDAAPRGKTGGAMGLLGTVSAIGTAAGPSLGGALISGFGWPAIFVVTGLLGAVAFILAYWHVPSHRSAIPAREAPFDIKGALVLTATLAAYALSMTAGNGAFGAINAALLLAAIGGAAAFVLIEARAPSPVVRLAMFRSPVLSIGCGVGALVAMVAMTTLVVGPFYLAGALGLTPVEIGLVMSCGPMVAALAGVPAGRAVDRFGAQRMSGAGLGMVLIGAAAMALSADRLSVFDYIASLAVITAGYALFQAANNTAVMQDADAAERGVVSGLLTLSRNLGLITGASAMGAVFAAANAGAGTAQPQAVAAGMAVTFWTAGGLVAAALLVAVLMAKRCGHDVAGIRPETGHAPHA